jgi:uncharacterized membrane protein YadS
MIFAAEFDWSPMDFLAMGVLLLGAGLTVRLLVKNVMSRYKKIYITIVIVLFFLLWAELSVGLF